MTEDMDVALAIARDADYWIVEIEFGSDISLLNETPSCTYCRQTWSQRHGN